MHWNIIILFYEMAFPFKIAKMQQDIFFRKYFSKDYIRSRVRYIQAADVKTKSGKWKYNFTFMFKLF